MLPHRGYARDRIARETERARAGACTRSACRSRGWRSRARSAGSRARRRSASRTGRRSPGEALGPLFATYWLRGTAVVPEGWAGSRADLLLDTGGEATLWLGGEPVQGLNSGPRHGPAGGGARRRAPRAASGSRSSSSSPATTCSASARRARGRRRRSRCARCELARFDAGAWQEWNDLEVLRRAGARAGRRPRLGGAAARRAARLHARRRPRAARAAARPPLRRAAPGERDRPRAPRHGVAVAARGDVAQARAHDDHAAAADGRVSRAPLRALAGAALRVARGARARALRPRARGGRARAVDPGRRDVGGARLQPARRASRSRASSSTASAGSRSTSAAAAPSCGCPTCSATRPSSRSSCGSRASTASSRRSSPGTASRRRRATRSPGRGSTGARSSRTSRPPTPTTPRRPCPSCAAAAAAYKDHPRSRHSLLVFGHGDGGGGPTAEMLERLRRMRDLAGLPPSRSCGRRRRSSTTSRPTRGTCGPSSASSTSSTTAAPTRRRRRSSAATGAASGRCRTRRLLDALLRRRPRRRRSSTGCGACCCSTSSTTSCPARASPRSTSAPGPTSRAWSPGADAVAARRARAGRRRARRPSAARRGARWWRGRTGGSCSPSCPACGAGRVMAEPDDRVAARARGRRRGRARERAPARGGRRRRARCAASSTARRGREALAAPGNALRALRGRPGRVGRVGRRPGAPRAARRRARGGAGSRRSAPSRCAPRSPSSVAVGERSRLRQAVRLDAGARRLELHTEVDWQRGPQAAQGRLPARRPRRRGDLRGRVRRGPAADALLHRPRPRPLRGARATAGPTSPSTASAPRCSRTPPTATARAAARCGSRSCARRGCPTRRPTAAATRSPTRCSRTRAAGRTRASWGRRRRSTRRVRWAARRRRPGPGCAVDGRARAPDSVKRAEDGDGLVLRLYEPHGGRGARDGRARPPGAVGAPRGPARGARRARPRCATARSSSPSGRGRSSRCASAVRSPLRAPAGREPPAHLRDRNGGRVGRRADARHGRPPGRVRHRRGAQGSTRDHDHPTAHGRPRTIARAPPGGSRITAACGAPHRRRSVGKWQGPVRRRAPPSPPRAASTASGATATELRREPARQVGEPLGVAVVVPLAEIAPALLGLVEGSGRLPLGER